MTVIKMTTSDVTYGYSNDEELTKDSPDYTYIPYEHALKNNAKLNFNLKSSTKDYFVKDDNDLIIISLFEYKIEEQTNTKIVINTVKNYFKYAKKYNFVHISQNGNWQGANNLSYDYISQNIFAPTEATYGQIIDYSLVEPEIFLGTKKADSYKFFNANKSKANDYIYDLAGNDSYQIGVNYKGSKKTEIHDFRGNDNYTFEKETRAKVYDSKGNDKYTSKDKDEIDIEDYEGKDLYNLNHANQFNIKDDAGNDKYNIYKTGIVNSSSRIEDLKGNDKYDFLHARFVTVIDKAGNDKYDLKGGRDISIEDSAGNDSYIVSYLSVPGVVTINDLLGNDKYHITDSYVEIDDKSGKDKYNILHSSHTLIKDKIGKDSYNISHAFSHITITDGEENETKSGDDKYNLSYISESEDDLNNSILKDYAGNDSYNISYSFRMNIRDEKGSDSYVIKDSSVNMKITDNGTAEKIGKKLNTKLANDKYTFINSSMDNITDKEGMDVYKLTNSYAKITDNGGSDKYTLIGYYDNVSDITDSNKSSDTYKLTNTKVKITDDGGKDSYNITSGYANIEDSGKSDKDIYNTDMKAGTIISDDGGSGDILKLNGANKNNLIYMVDYSDDSDTYPGAVYSGNLIIFDKTTKGFAEIKNYFSMESSYIRYTDSTRTKAVVDSDYCIETIYAGKTNITNNILNQLSSSEIDAISANVAVWLQNEEHQYDSVSKLLESGDNTNISNFIATFVNQNP